ncbi:hypothetical protein V1264_024660 [Littorina saxatilis]|uniref:Uncharacterized protein n=1 Tax=Littorina saxatilis TaxID=31220 RepID=A0AAN9AL36_9CAEN
MNISETTRLSPFFLMYNRDVVLPLGNILKPRRKYAGEEHHRIALQEQHKAFTLVHKRLKKAKKRQANYAHKNSKPVEIKVGDPVYYKHHQRKSKLQSKWKPYFRVVEQPTPVTFVIRNQLDDKTTRVHAEHLRLAKIDDWQIPKDNLGRPRRNVTYVVPPEDSSTDKQSSESERETPLATLAKKYRQEREGSSQEDDIPLMELSKRIKARQRRERQRVESDNRSSPSDYSDRAADESDREVEDMEVNALQARKKKSVLERSQNKKDVTKWLQAIVGVLK